MAKPYLGQIEPVGFNFPPRGWALCSGALLAIAQNTALFSLLGTAFGGDGRTTSDSYGVSLGDRFAFEGAKSSSPDMSTDKAVGIIKVTLLANDGCA